MRYLPAGVWVAFCAAAFAQPPQHERPHMAFEVVSVKLNKSLDTNMSMNLAAGGQLNCTNATVRFLITFAYAIRDYQLENLPAWTGTDRYDIFAKLSSEDAAMEPDPRSEGAQDHLRHRTQVLLAERVGLVLHSETKDGPMFNLVAAKDGPKLTPTQTEGPPQSSFNNTRVTCTRITMKQFADMVLTSRMGRPVVDKTGLSGTYDLQMEFAPDSFGPGGASPDSDLGSPSFSTALQEQLGLRLAASKGPTAFLVVEKIERPTGN